LNRGRHLYSTGRPSRLALAHISSYVYISNGGLKLQKFHDKQQAYEAN